MNASFFRRAPALLAVALALRLLPSSDAADAPAETRILKWKDGKKAVFMLAFDDGAPSQLKNVIPELEKRKIPGSFYLVTGNSLYASLKSKWETATKSPYVMASNHTFTHKGVNNAEELDGELAKNNEVLYALHPERPQPRLLPFGHPGGVPWKVTKEELQAALEKHHLIERPPFHGPPIHFKSAEETVAVVDKALEKGEVGHLDFHGVGGDWLTTPLDWFTAVLDRLEANREQFWITNPASLHKYVKERETAEVKTLESGKDRIRLALTAKVDPALYDEPLTLSTRVPADWKRCIVTQGTTKAEATAQDGAVQYSAIPGGGEITLQSLAEDK